MPRAPRICIAPDRDSRDARPLVNQEETHAENRRKGTEQGRHRSDRQHRGVRGRVGPKGAASQVVVLVLAGLVLLALASPAGANTIPVDEVTISCTGVDFDWRGFPARPVDLTVTVTFDDQNSTSVVSTEGARRGSGSVPLDLTGSGTASVVVSWTLGETEHHSETVTAVLDCETPPPPTTVSSAATTVPTTASSPVKYRMIPPATASPELPNTGVASGTWVLLGLGWFAIAFGAALLFAARVRRTEQ